MNTTERSSTPDHIIVDTANGNLRIPIYSKEGYELLTKLWMKSAWQHRFSYQFTWLGIPIIQLPEDMMMMQELVYKIRPDVIIETGVAHGGSAIFYASLCELLGKGRVISIDIEIRQYNRLAIQSHPMSNRITLIEGSSTSPEVVTQVRQLIRPQESVLVVLDSNHSYAHVREELRLYSPLVTAASYVVVFDGVMEDLADAPNASGSWIRDNPLSAIREFLAEQPEFEQDPYYNRVGVTYCPGGYLRRLEPSR